MGITITRPHEGRHHIAYPYRLGSPPLYATLVVGSTEMAVFRRHGHIVGTLGPGQHSMSPTGAPFLTSLRSSDGTRYDCDIMFISTAPVRMNLDGPVGPLTDIAGRAPVFQILGSATFQAPDPIRFAREGVGMGEGGEGLDMTLRRRLMDGISHHLPSILTNGSADPSRLASFGPALVSAGAQDQLGLAVVGIIVLGVEISRIASAEGRPPAGRNAGELRARLSADEALPKFQSCRFGVTRIPFSDTDFDMTAHVSAVGYFEGDEIKSPVDQWLKESIIQIINHAAKTWQGTVLDVPGKREDWARYVTQVVVPELTQKTGLRGRVVIEAVEILREDEVELKRRRASKLHNG